MLVHIWNNDDVTWMLGACKVEFDSVPKYNYRLFKNMTLRSFYHSVNHPQQILFIFEYEMPLRLGACTCIDGCTRHN